MHDDPDKPTLLLRCATEFEAELRASALRAANIECRVIRGVASAVNLGPVFGPAYEIYVREDDLRRAQEALRYIATGGPAPSDDEDRDGEPAEEESPATNPTGERDVPTLGMAFVVGLAFGVFTLFVPYTAAVILKAPLGGPERNIIGALWVLFFGMIAAALRERFPFTASSPKSERDDGVTRTHFRDTRLALVCWFLLGAGFFGPSTFFFIGVLLLPIVGGLKNAVIHAGATPQLAAMLDGAVILAWCLLCGFWTVRYAMKRRRDRRIAAAAPRLAD